MSVRKRIRYTTKQLNQIRPRAEEMAAGGDWLEFRDEAAAALEIKPLETWIVDYFDGSKRRSKTFDKKKDADDCEAKYRVEIIDGTHVAESASITVAAAGELWLKSAEAAGLEPTTIQQYQQHVRLHIVPFIGTMKLSRLTAPAVRQFTDRLLQERRSQAMVRCVRRSLGTLIADAQSRGLIVRNPVHETRAKKKTKREGARGSRLKIGINIPTPSEIKSIIQASKGRWRPFFLTAIFTGLRASELRGLRWSDVDFKRGELHVRQRADRNAHRPHSLAGRSCRTVTLPPTVVQSYGNGKLACPNSSLDLAFPAPCPP
jgi:integrase